MRSFRRSYELIMENVVQDNEVDFFISHEKNINDQEVEEFKKLFKPKKIMRSDEIYPNIDKYVKPIQTNPHNMMCMFLNRLNVYKIFEEYCNETNTNYDVIMSNRVDIQICSKIDFNQYMEKINNDIIFIPGEHDYGGINDRIAFGNKKVMKEYLTCFNNLIEIYESGLWAHPESSVLRNLNIKKIQIERFPLNYGFI